MERGVERGLQQLDELPVKMGRTLREVPIV